MAEFETRPDPTVLTTEQLHRAIGDVKEIIKTRLDAMDKARVLSEETRKSELIGLRELLDEKFDAIQMQFRERDTQTAQRAADSKMAVDAALQAAKEAVSEQNKSSALAIGKAEASTMKQMDQMGTLIQTGAKGVDDKFSDVKDRLTRIEGLDHGKAVAKDDHNTNTTQMVSIFAVILTLIGVAVAVIVAFHK